MSSLDFHDVKRLIVTCLEGQIVALGHNPQQLPDSFDLRVEGVIDSLGFLQLLSELEERLGVEVDVADLEPENLTVLGALAAHISAAYRQVDSRC